MEKDQQVQYIKGLSTSKLCHIASVNLYALASQAKDEDTTGRALFFLSELEHYTREHPPSAHRRLAIERFILACRNLRLRLEALTLSIPELSDLQ